MSAYHAMAAHFPIAIWMTVFLFIVLRSFTSKRAQQLEFAITLLLALGALAGLLTYLLGWAVWSIDALLYSPLARNHILMATWTLAYWCVLWLLYWRIGERIWQGLERWSMLLLSIIGITLLSITGTLGGSLAGNPSGLPRLLAVLGWNTNSTFYLPSAMVIFTLISAGLLLLLGWYANRQK